MTVGALTYRDVLTASPDTAVGDVAAAMRDRDSSTVVVVDEHRAVGFLAAADIGRAYVAGEDLGSKSAGDVAVDPLVVHESDDVPFLVDAFAEADTRRAVVVDENGDFVGVVTLSDVLARYGRDFGRVLSLFDAE